MAEQADSGRDPLFEGSRFQRLLRQAHDANLIELSKTDYGHYMLKLNPGALVEDRDEREGAGGAAEEEAEGAGGAEGVGENSASGKRRRGRRGGRGRGTGRGQRDDAEVSEEPAPAAEHVAEARPERVTSGAADAESAATSRHRNPRFRHGSRGLARPAAEGPASPAASPTAVPTVMATTTARPAIQSDSRAPYSSRLSRSRP